MDKVQLPESKIMTVCFTNSTNSNHEEKNTIEKLFIKKEIQKYSQGGKQTLQVFNNLHFGQHSILIYITSNHYVVSQQLIEN